jgi:hypothetical protein
MVNLVQKESCFAKEILKTERTGKSEFQKAVV